MKHNDHAWGNIKSLQGQERGLILGPDIGRQELESTIRSRLEEYGIESRNIYIDAELRTVIALCMHITGGMKIFMSGDNMALGGVTPNSMVSAHRIRAGNGVWGLIVIYCKSCFDKGVRMMFEEK
jgi:hypothetical protein